MSFDNPLFLLVLIGSMAVIRLPKGPAGWGLLSISALFYSLAGVYDSALFAAVLIVNWFASVRVQQSRAIFVIAIVVNVGILSIFKYREMFLPGYVAAEFGRIAIPLGISFYLFHILGYLADLRAGRTTTVSSQKFFLFVGFFPHLIAGPIVRARQLMPQLEPLWRGGRTRLNLMTFGLVLCLSGLIKKVIFSNSLSPLVDDIFYRPPDNSLVAWAGAWLFGFQIYFDFSGYTDIALGAAMLLGIRLPNNFRTPYLSTNPKEFWQRWHITLSSWIRDYLYIPLGGNRTGGVVRQSLVLLFVMTLAGLWHGANWTFVIWGALWAGYILIWRVLAPAMKYVPVALRWLLNVVVVMNLWVIFRAPNFDFAVLYLHKMYSFDIPEAPTLSLVVSLLGCLALMLLHWIESLTQGIRAMLVVRRLSNPATVSCIAGLCLLLLLFPNTDINPFIYFRF